MSKATQTLITTLVCTVLAACGGGGGSSDNSTATTTSPTSTTGTTGTTGATGTTPANPAAPAGTTTSQNGQNTGDTSGSSTTASSGASGAGSTTGTGTGTGSTATTTTPTTPTSANPTATAAATADATQARFNGPTGMKFAANGDLYVADSLNFTVRKIASNGVVTTIAGKAGVQGTADGIGSAALFTQPRGVTVDGAGNIYVTDGSVVRRITPAGAVTTLAGRQGEVDNVDGNGANARFRSPEGIVVDAAGNLFVADPAAFTIRRITPAGNVTTFAGETADGTGFRFSGPYGLAIDGAGNLYVADDAATPGRAQELQRFSSFVRKITPAGVVSTLAGNYGRTATTGDPMSPIAMFSNATGIAVDAAGYVYIIDHFNDGNGIKRVAPDSTVTVLPITATGGWFSRLMLDGAGNLFVSDSVNNTIDRVSPSGIVTVYAGKAGEAGSADTP